MRVVTKTEVVEVPVEVYKPLPETLTQPLNYPQNYLDGGAVTVNDLIDMIFEFYDIVDQANGDREKAAQLTQPSDEAPPAPVPD